MNVDPSDYRFEQLHAVLFILQLAMGAMRYNKLTSLIGYAGC